MKKLIALGVLVTLTGCMANDPNRNTKTGAAVGAAVGAGVGYAIDDGAGGVIAGAAVGALVGGGVGYYMDKQRQEMEAALAEEQARKELNITQLADGTLKIGIASEVSFDFDSAGLKPAFMPTLNKVADIFQRYPKTVIHVVGHTDSVGSESYNMTLSQKRAQSVADLFLSKGVMAERLRAHGRGETQPIASNETDVGRAQNRRVEIFVKPIVEGKEAEAYQAP